MKKERVFWGILLVLVGITLIISKMGYFPDINVFSLLLTAFLISVIIKSALRANFPGILFPIAFICIIYDNQLGITALTPWTVLISALLGSIGLSMIFPKSNKYYKYFNKYNWDSSEFETIDIEDESIVRVQTSFGNSIKYINTDKFEKAELGCRFGSMKIYFDNAIMNNNNAVVSMDISFSGVELYIPKTWTINDRTNISFGGINEKNKNQSIENNNVTLIGNINFSEVEIIYI